MAKVAENTELVPQPPAQSPQSTQSDIIPSDLLGLAAEHAGEGVSTNAEHNVVPLVRRLQKMSDQLDENHGDFIAGARPGDIWLRDVSVLIKGSDGIVFQPCFFRVEYPEWRPRGGGGGSAPVHRWSEMPEDAVEKVDDSGRRHFLMPGGNEIIPTHYFTGFVMNMPGSMPALPVVIPMKATDIAIARSWMTRMNLKPLLADGKLPPSYLYLYRLTTKPRSNAEGTWHTWAVDDYGAVQSRDQFQRGSSLFHAMASQERVEEAATGEM